MSSNLPNYERLFFDLFKKAANGIFILDANWQLFEVDGAFARLLKIKQVLDEPVQLASLFESAEEFNALKLQARAKRFVQNKEVVLKTRGKQKIFAELSIMQSNNLNTGKRVYLGVLYNVAKRKKAERALLQAEKLLAAGKLSRILAHEIRNPLTNVQLALEQLKDEFSEQAEEAELYFDVIERNASRIGKLITELLNSSKPKTLNLRLQDVNTVVEDALLLVKDRLTLKEIKLQLKLDPKNPAVNLDAEQLKLALVNLMVNAIEAMDEGRGILKVNTQKKRGSIQISVIDNGYGLNEEEIEMLFEPFYTKKREGTGLGLTTVQNIVHSHKGNIDVSSIPGKQTKFELSLPV